MGKQNLNKDWSEITDKAMETDDWTEYESVSKQFSDANPLMDNAEVPYRTGFGNLNLANWIAQNVPKIAHTLITFTLILVNYQNG